MIKVFFLIFSFLVLGDKVSFSMEEIESSIKISTEHNWFSWKTECSLIVNCEQDRIWKIWTDVKNWKKWDEDVENSSMRDDFELGSLGTLKPRGGPSISFTITDLEKLRRFSNISSLPLWTSINFIHEMENLEGRVRVKHTVRIDGVMTPLFSRVIGRNIELGLPSAMKKMALLAEGRMDY